MPPESSRAPAIRAPMPPRMKGVMNAAAQPTPTLVRAPLPEPSGLLIWMSILLQHHHLSIK